ncbi:hypothetical protein MKW94_004971 [Papaver nudicaule]|uniref:RING-type E3 ubiquitin transferase n=1 Tax=Papaver nudicaule TaxID=74823 RepID=A0AA41VXL4_PAPNU|nr:hypothetical protein [Papaver nudicaule]
MRIICPIIAFIVLVLFLLNYFFHCFPPVYSNTHETSASSIMADSELHDFVHVTILDRPDSITRNGGTCYLNCLDKRIPVHTYSSSLLSPKASSDYPSENSNNYDENCSICLCELSNGETVRVLPKCKHIFHKECIDEWLPLRSLHCPICRAQVIEVNIHEQKSGTHRTNGDGTSNSSGSSNHHGWSMSFTSLMLNLDHGLYPHAPPFM